MKNNFPILNFSQDEQKDVQEIFQFAKEGDQYILDWFPELKNVSQNDLVVTVKKIVHGEYAKNKIQIEEKINFLESKKEMFNKLTQVMAEICEENWEGVVDINVFVGVNPIAPRYLQEKYFMIPMHESNESLLGFCAHELIHYIYFKKWHSLFRDSYETYEYPHKTWVLSEILVPVILSDKRLQEITSSLTVLYPHWQEFDLKYNLIERFSDIFKERRDFAEFLRKSSELYNTLDQEFNLTDFICICA